MWVVFIKVGYTLDNLLLDHKCVDLQKDLSAWMCVASCKLKVVHYTKDVRWGGEKWFGFKYIPDLTLNGNFIDNGLVLHFAYCVYIYF